MEVAPLILEVAPLICFRVAAKFSGSAILPFFLRFFHKNLVAPHQWRALVAPPVQSD